MCDLIVKSGLTDRFQLGRINMSCGQEIDYNCDLIRIHGSSWWCIYGVDFYQAHMLRIVFAPRAKVRGRAQFAEGKIGIEAAGNHNMLFAL